MALGFLTSGCMFRSVSEHDLIGKYRADLPDGGVETLELLPGGDCVQEIRLHSGLSYSARGKWRYDESVTCVYLDGTRQALTPDHKINPDMARIDTVTAAPSVSRTIFGTVTIGSSEGFQTGSGHGIWDSPQLPFERGNIRFKAAPTTIPKT
jgi:hypothetical protein